MRMTEGDWAPGQVWPAAGDIEAFDGRAVVELTVRHTGDRPIQVGSHFHFFEVNRALRFEREKAWGFRLAIPSGTAIRFEPGATQTVELVALAGDRVVHGFNGLVSGSLDDAGVKARGLAKARERGFLHAEAPPSPPESGGSL